MKRNNTTAELGRYKENISPALYHSTDIRDLLLGDQSNMSTSQLQAEFQRHVKSHIFIDDTITETDSFIFYDVVCPHLRTTTKDCRVIMYAICHRDILDNYVRENYYGNRADILAQMIENTLINDASISNKFGIGELTLDSIDIYNSKRFYGRILTFSVPTFR